MKRSEINAQKEKIQTIEQSARQATLNLLASNKDNIYTMGEIKEVVMTEEFKKWCAGIGCSKDDARDAIVRAVCALEFRNDIVRERVGSDDYYGSK